MRLSAARGAGSYTIAYNISIGEASLFHVSASDRTLSKVVPFQSNPYEVPIYASINARACRVTMHTENGQTRATRELNLSKIRSSSLQKLIQLWNHRQRDASIGPNLLRQSSESQHLSMLEPPKDADFQLRIDAGRYNPQTRKLNAILQVNKEAKSPGLKDWAKKYTTHERLATASFDTNAPDPKAEYDRVLEDLEKKQGIILANEYVGS
jgi:hypothetical protein